MKKLLMLALATSSLSLWAATAEQPDRNESQYSNQYPVVLDGYDPVSYFPEGGGTPAKGDQLIHHMYGMRIYHFASAANRDLFIANPLKYEPTYGSWCAYGMANGAKIKINPLVYTINGNRSHFFINRSAKGSFDSDLVAREASADRHWKRFSGEEPRL